MATLTIRIDDQTRRSLESVARSRGTTVSNVLRSGIDDMLQRDPRTDRSGGCEVPETLTTVEREHLALLHDVLAQMPGSADDPDRREHHVRMAGALRSGFTGEYQSVFGGIDTEMPMRDCRLVWDLLDMFRVLRVSLERLPAHDQPTVSTIEDSLHYRGFDFADSREGKMAQYVQHLVSSGRWTEFDDSDTPERDYGNSHHVMLPTYVEMLERFAPVWREHTRTLGRPLELNADELLAVAGQ